MSTKKWTMLLATVAAIGFTSYFGTMEAGVYQRSENVNVVDYSVPTYDYSDGYYGGYGGYYSPYNNYYYNPGYRAYYTPSYAYPTYYYNRGPGISAYVPGFGFRVGF